MSKFFKFNQIFTPYEKIIQFPKHGNISYVRRKMYEILSTFKGKGKLH